MTARRSADEQAPDPPAPTTAGPAPARPAPAPARAFSAVRFPAGASAPANVLVVALLLVAVTAVLGVRSAGVRTVDPAVLDAQQRAARTAASALDAGARRGLDAVAAATARGAPLLAVHAVPALHDLEAAVPDLDAAAVVDTTTPRVLAHRGDLPLTRPLPVGRVFLQDRGAGREPRAVMSVPAGPDRLVVAAVTLHLPAPDPNTPFGLHQAVISSSGHKTAVAGRNPPGNRAAEAGLVRRVAAAARGGTQGDLADTTALLDADRDQDRPVASASFAAVGPSIPGTPTLAVTALAEAPPQVGPRSHPGLILALGLVVLAALAHLAIRCTLVRPLRRLRSDTDLVLDEPDAGHRVRRSRIREVDAIAVAFRDDGPGRSDDDPGRRWSARLIVPAVCAALLAWLIVGMITVGRGPVEDAHSHLAGTGDIAAEATEALRQRFDDGDARVRDAVTLQLGAAIGGDLIDRTRELLAAPDLFRSVYVVDATGRVVHVAGRAPARTAEPIPPTDGVHQLNVSGRMPVLAASAWTSDRAHALVAEYDITALSALLRHPDTRVRVVDARDLLVLDSEGFRAFGTLGDRDLVRAADDAHRGVPVLRTSVINGDDSTLAAAPVGSHDAAAGPGWAVVATQQVSAVDFRRDSATRHVLVVAGLGAAVTTSVLLWILVVVLGPLRRAGRAATTDGTAAFAPEHLDEVGAIVANLNARRRRRAVPAPPAPPNPALDDGVAAPAPPDEPGEDGDAEHSDSGQSDAERSDYASAALT